MCKCRKKILWLHRPKASSRQTDVQVDMETCRQTNNNEDKERETNVLNANKEQADNRHGWEKLSWHRQITDMDEKSYHEISR